MICQIRNETIPLSKQILHGIVVAGTFAGSASISRDSTTAKKEQLLLTAEDLCIRMNKRLFLLALLGIASCAPAEKATPPPSPYLRMVGDIVYDPQIDDQDFKTCHGEEMIIQYFNASNGLQYEGEKPAIQEAFTKTYKPVRRTDQSGLLRIRFVVNCNGETGMYRLLGMDAQYNEKTFDPAITDQVLQITSNLKGWKQQILANTPRDYYQYLILKLEGGEIKEILP